MKSEALSIKEYIASLPPERREQIEKVRKVILDNIDSEYEEGINYGMISFFVPLKMFPAGYNGNPNQPLMLAALASQKNYLSLYLGGTYCGCGEGAGQETKDMKWFRDEWSKTDKKLTMGKACVRFKKADDLALNVIAEAIKRLPARKYIEHYEKVLAEKNRNNQQSV